MTWRESTGSQREGSTDGAASVAVEPEIGAESKGKLDLKPGEGRVTHIVAGIRNRPTQIKE